MCQHVYTGPTTHASVYDCLSRNVHTYIVAALNVVFASCLDASQSGKTLMCESQSDAFHKGRHTPYDAVAKTWAEPEAMRRCVCVCVICAA